MNQNRKNSTNRGARAGAKSSAAQRALAEARARRAAIDARNAAAPNEIDGRGGLEPTRYDDWEVKGLASDF